MMCFFRLNQRTGKRRTWQSALSFRAFYDYARANPNGRPQFWSEWLKPGVR
jgi:hypothetical protein